MVGSSEASSDTVEDIWVLSEAFDASIPSTLTTCTVPRQLEGTYNKIHTYHVL